MDQQRAPLPLPENFDPDANMIAKVTENGVFHESRAGAALAYRLAANGTPADLALAEKVLEVVLNAQERRPQDPHHGNFMWMIEDDVVFDLNAVEFNLEYLIPMMIEYGSRLPAALQARVLDAVRLGLDEIRRLDVLVAYSNITVLDILNTCLGGELLGEPSIAQRGYHKLVAWMALTDREGIPFEYNSPTYVSVIIRALKQLVDLVQDPTTRVLACLAAGRLGLSVALHIHRATGRWTGPHSRSYHPSVVCETPPEETLLRQWVSSGALPGWVMDAYECRPDAFAVTETAFAAGELGITTYHSRSFALGVSVKEAGGQSDVAMAHYERPGAERPGVLYTRYLLNDKWLGDFYHATDRTKSRNLVEEGRFYGVQQGPSMIGLYAIPNSPGVISSAKAALIFTEYARVEEIWVGSRKVEQLPVEIPQGETAVIGSGSAWIAVRPLTRTDIGRGAPVRLVERQGDLVLEIYNYLGEAKSFWELGWPGAFYKGKPQCGFYLEVAERSAYPDGSAFAQTVDSGSLADEADTPFTYAGDRPRLWRVAYCRSDTRLGIEVDLMEWKLKRRWTGAQNDLGWPMLESPVARQNRAGEVRVGDAVLTCGGEAGWLFACPERGRWVAGYHGLQPAPLALSLPVGSVMVEAMGAGTVVWDNGNVTIDALGVQGHPQVRGGTLLVE